MIAVLCGGVGAARYLRGLLGVMPADQIVAIVNTGDDCELHGLSISPDLDTITYTLANAIDPDRGWGLRDESWRALEALRRYVHVTPAGSSAASTWFGLGDTDLATHMYRTHRLAEGATLTEVTAEIARAWQLGLTMLPMTDDSVRTRVKTLDFGEISFQEYFVRHRHGVAVESLRFDGAQTARVPSAVLAAIATADRIVIAPSNPLVSIGPLRALSALETALRDRRHDVVAISPIVGGKALKGPADRLLVELGHEATQAAIARLYAPIAATLIIDHVDLGQASSVSAAGVRPVVTSTVMSDRHIAEQLATISLSAVE
jgi:LPPG:FO 2-phospho-L-lactate transferase